MATASFYLSAAGETVAALLDRPTVVTGSPVLICAPWGWDESASYRSRRTWAAQLAAAGHPTLRFDLPSTGDSGGVPTDPDRVDAWVAAVGAAAEWLRTEGETGSVAAIGLGLGGLLARESISRGAAIDQLVLWGAPGRGRSFVREAKAFSRLQSGKDAEEGVKTDGIMAGGFLLDAATVRDLGALAPAPGATLRRALLLGRDGLHADEELAESMRVAGVAVDTGPGEGWGVFVEHPERTAFPAAVGERVAAWLEPAAVPSGAEPDASTVEAVVFGEGPRRVTEQPWHLDLDFGRAFGILARPDVAGACCAVFLNAGALRHTGPNRMWTEAARRSAERGLNVLRIDLEGIGEADGAQTGLEGVDGFYEPRYERQLRAVLDRLAAEGHGERFLCIGLCAGGYLAYRAALDDRRVEHAVLLNAGALAWREDIVEEREARKLDRAFDRRWWRKLLTGQVPPRRLVTVLVSFLRSRLASLRAGGEGGSRPDIVSDLDSLDAAGTRLTMAFSDNEPLQAELKAEGVLGQAERWPNLDLPVLPGADHTLRSISAQRALLSLLDAETGRFLGADAARGTPQSP